VANLIGFPFMISVLVWGILAGLGSWLIGFPVYRLLSRLGLLDKPNDRSSHSVPTVRGGGLGVTGHFKTSHSGSIQNPPP